MDTYKGNRGREHHYRAKKKASKLVGLKHRLTAVIQIGADLRMQSVCIHVNGMRFKYVHVAACMHAGL